MSSVSCVVQSEKMDARRTRREIVSTAQPETSMRASLRTFVVALLAPLALAVPLAAQGGRGVVDSAAITRIRDRYKKTEVRIRARDGAAALHGRSTTPRDTSRRYPIMMTRTPYGVAPYGPEQYPARLGPAQRFSDDGFIFVYQDTRGVSCRRLLPVHDAAHRRQDGTKDVDESTDTYDTIDWLMKNVPHNNGRVGTLGHLRARLLHRRRDDRRASGAQGGESHRRR